MEEENKAEDGLEEEEETTAEQEEALEEASEAVGGLEAQPGAKDANRGEVALM